LAGSRGIDTDRLEPHEEAFCALILAGKDQSEAVREVGHWPGNKQPAVVGHRLMKKPKIAAYLQAAANITNREWRYFFKLHGFGPEDRAAILAALGHGANAGAAVAAVKEANRLEGRDVGSAQGSQVNLTKYETLIINAGHAGGDRPDNEVLSPIREALFEDPDEDAGAPAVHPEQDAEGSGAPAEVALAHPSQTAAGR